MVLPAIIEIAIGIVVLIMGRQLKLFAAAAGFIIGFELTLRLFGESNILAAIFAGIGLAIGAAVLISIAKGAAQLIAGVIGAIACAGLALSLLRLLGLDLGLFNWVLAVGGGLVGFVLMMRFFDWGLIIIACLIGASLASNGLQDWLNISAALTSAVGIVLFILGFVYQARAVRAK